VSKSAGEENVNPEFLQERNVLPCGAKVTECEDLEALVIAVGGDTQLAKLCAIAAVTGSEPSVVPGAVAIVEEALKFGCLVRSPHDLGSAGRVTVVVFDKTGVLTGRDMKVERLVFGAKDVDGNVNAGQIDMEDVEDMLTLPLSLLKAVALSTSPQGPTDRALEDCTKAASAVIGQTPEDLRVACDVEIALPFNSRTKLEARVACVDGQSMLFIKGALDRVLALCESVGVGDAGEQVPLSEKLLAELNEKFGLCAAEALRGLGFACKPHVKGQEITIDDVKQLQFLGGVFLGVPLSFGAHEAVGRLHALGIKTGMATGDQKLTAVAVARKIGLIEGTETVGTTGADVENWDSLAGSADMVLARATPEDKANLVEALQKQGHIVCAVGDGVNDAPMLSASDFPIAMANGSPITKSAAKCLSLDGSLQAVAQLLERCRTICKE